MPGRMSENALFLLFCSSSGTALFLLVLLVFFVFFFGLVDFPLLLALDREFERAVVVHPSVPRNDQPPPHVVDSNGAYSY